MHGIHKYRAARVEAASQAEIVQMLFEEVLRRLAAIEVLHDEPMATRMPHLHHSRRIFLELTGALDDEAAPELCERLRGLYQFCLRELVAFGRDDEAAHLHNVRSVTRSLLDGWKQILNGRVAA